MNDITTKNNNLVAIGQYADKYWATLSLIFEQTEDMSKAVFFFDWETRQFYMMDGTDTSDPNRYIMFCVSDSCLYAPKRINLSTGLYLLNRNGYLPLSITFQRAETELLTAAEFDAEFPNIRKQLAKEAANYGEYS